MCLELNLIKGIIMIRKKLLLLVILGVLIVSGFGSSNIIAISSDNIRLNNVSNFETDNNMDEPPEWAMGSFNGTWGRCFLGIKGEELGWIEGYWESELIGYTRFEKGHFEGYSGEWADEEPTKFIKAEYLSYHISDGLLSFGKSTTTYIDTGKESSGIGLGKLRLEGTLEYRFIIIPGFNWYFSGSWDKFEYP